MTATLTPTDRESATFEIVPVRLPGPSAYQTDAFTVTMNGEPLRNRNGNVRYFATRASARKRITRERRGDFR